MYIKLIILTIIICSSSATSEYNKVQELTSALFKEKVVNSKNYWLVLFHSQDSEDNEQFRQEFEKAQKALEGVLSLGTIDIQQQPDAAALYSVSKTPIMKFFGQDKQKPVDFTLEKSSDNIASFGMDQLKQIVRSRQKSKAEKENAREKRRASRSAEKEKESSTSSGVFKEKKAKIEDGAVYVLDDSNFDHHVINSNELWFIFFYAPWCGHCQKMTPDWIQAAKQLKGKVNFAKIDATVATRTAARFQISGYPNIKFVPPGSQDKHILDYNLARDKSSFISYANEQREKYKGEVFIELTNQKLFDEHCINAHGICVILFVPHIYDSSKDQRNGYLQILQTVSKTNKNKPISFYWTQGGDQLQIEESLGFLGAGYPYLLALSYKKQVFTNMRASFTQQNVETFVNNLLSGKETKWTQYKNFPSIKTVKNWDGKDQKPQKTHTEDF